MNNYQILDDLTAENNGYLLTAMVTDKHISKTTLAAYVRRNKMQRIAHGVYLSENAWEDPFYLIAIQNKKVIFSYESALYLHGMMDREPVKMTVTVPNGYNASHLTKQGIRVTHSTWYEVGKSAAQTVFGNPVPVYDRERTICDIIRRKDEIEIQTFQTALNEYMRESNKNLGNLINYAKLFRIEDKVRIYTEVLL